MSEYVVELKNITKRFPGVVALKNMSIGIRPGEIHGLIGENGAGKSTTMNIITIMMENVAVAADTTIITTMRDIIMQMMYSQAGVRKHRINMIKQHLKVF